MRDVRPRTRLIATALATVALTATLAACSSDSGDTQTGTDDFTIRVAMGSTGKAVDDVFTTLKQQYEEKYPGRTVEIIIQEDDTYETIGLTNLLTSRNAPDVYFERPGTRMQTKVDDGYGADITDEVSQPAFTDRIENSAYSGMVIDGKTYMVPWSGDVTNVFWYNEQIFADNNLTPPTTWADFMDICSALKAAGITPLIDGNKDKWPVGSIASHLAERAVGNDAYVAAIMGQEPMNSPDMVTAFGHLQELADNGYINESVNALPDDQATSQFLLGDAAMIGIGSWLVSDQLSQEPNLKLNYFNMPQIDGSGDPESVLGVSTGFMVNAKSEHISAATDFLALMSTQEASQMFAEAGLTPLTIDPFKGVKADPNTVSLAALLSGSPLTVAPADTLDVKRADEFYLAAAAVIGGLKTPQEALDEAQSRVAALPSS